METIWFWLVAFMIVMYVLLDGFDLGVGALHKVLARNDDERRLLLRTIGPVWDGNEVWLIALGGTLYFAFPLLYASSFSGFYLPLMMVLWLLMLRGLAIELRNHLDGPLWRALWDTLLVGASALLAVIFGAALGNVVRGVPLNAEGRFFAPLWIGSGHEVGILDTYTCTVGLAALVALAVHGACWVILKTDGPLHDRARGILRPLGWLLVVLTLAVTIGTFRVQPMILDHLVEQPWRLLFPTVAVAGLSGILYYGRRPSAWRPFVASSAYLVGMLGAVVAGVYPYVLPSTPAAENGLTVWNAAAPLTGLRVGLAWWIPGMLLVLGYFAWNYKNMPRKVSLSD